MASRTILQHDGSLSADTRVLPSTSVYVCSRNPLAIWAIRHLLAHSSFNRRVLVFFATPLPISSKGAHILLIDAASVPEWPEVVPKWTSAGYRAILLVGERWGFGGAIHRALNFGVSGIVHAADELGTYIAEAITLVAGGQLWVKQHLNECHLESQRKKFCSSEPYFSFREKQVMDLITLGFSNRKIGSVLGISERTAKFHVHNLLHKLGLKKRSEIRAINIDSRDAAASG